jgi:DHA1 family bicyclomycin/chloramphenicol resistance-like MFS transporter
MDGLLWHRRAAHSRAAGTYENARQLARFRLGRLARGMSHALLIVFCGLLLGVSAFSCDITLPAFWSIEADLSAPVASVQAIVPVFLIFQSIGQLLFGPVSDRYGRRPVILGGLMLYLLGAAIGGLAHSIGIVHVGRAAQGFGSACGIVVARAVLRDVTHGVALAQSMALAMAVFSLGPIVAPLLGYGLVVLAGWRGVFAAMAILGGLLLLWAQLWFRETNARLDASALRPERLLQSLRRILGNRQSRFFLILSAATQFGIISFIANAPRFFKSAFDIEGLEFAVLFACTGLGIVLGQVANSRLIAAFGVLATTRLASFVLMAVAALIVALLLADAMPGIVFAVMMFTFNTSFLVVIANSASLVIDPHREIAGFASSAYGFFTQLAASSLAILTMPLFAGGLLPWSLALLIVTVSVFALLMLYRQGQPAHP